MKDENFIFLCELFSKKPAKKELISTTNSGRKILMYSYVLARSTLINSIYLLDEQ